jgi:hypothetical protein
VVYGGEQVVVAFQIVAQLVVVALQTVTQLVVVKVRSSATLASRRHSSLQLRHAAPPRVARPTPSPFAFEERGSGFLHPLSPLRHFDFPVSLLCWRSCLA